MDDGERLAVATQLVAVSALLGEAELWPGQRALENALAERVRGAVRVRLPTMPVSLSRVWARLGGGEPAARITRRAALNAIHHATGVDLAAFDCDGGEPGFFLDQVLERMVQTVDLPLDRATARSLWMWRWSRPELPEPGDTIFVDVPRRDVAHRVGAAVWSAAVRAGRGGVLEVVSAGRDGRVALERNGDDPVRVVVGDFDDRAVGSLAVPMDSAGSSTVAVGRFPSGWHPSPVELFRAGRLESHLAVVGVGPARRRRFLGDLAHRFDPFSSKDLGGLTDAAAVLFKEPRRRPTGRSGSLARIIGLAPEGIATDLALDLAEAAPSELEAALRDRVIMERDGRVLLPMPRPLQPDPLHAEIAEDVGLADEDRMLHRALAAGDAGEILIWARDRLNALELSSVRALLQKLQPGALGDGVQAALAEACLGLADMDGAGRAIAKMSDGAADPWRTWHRLLDRDPNTDVSLPRSVQVRHAARACAEIALVALRRNLGWSADEAGRALVIIGKAADRLEGAARRWIEIRLAARLRPQQLVDRGWRKTTTGGHPELVGLVLFERSTRAILDGDWPLARRLLRRVMAAESAPGRLALMSVNLGHVEAELGRPGSAEILMLRAYRLFQAAGFRHRERVALHNLAVQDIDGLRLDRAAQRLDTLSESEGSVYVAVEQARLSLAAGRLREFRCRVQDLPCRGEVSDKRVVEALSLLEGTVALLDGALDRAEDLLRAGGDEGRSWIDLSRAIRGSRGDEDPEVMDGWGVGRAAIFASRLRRGQVPTITPDGAELRDAVAMALCCQLGLRPSWPKSSQRFRAARLLHATGLDGWAAVLRWTPQVVNSFFPAVSTLIRNGGVIGGDRVAAEGLLRALGIDGLLVRDCPSGEVIFRIGSGDEFQGALRDGIEIVPLGTEPLPGGAWELVLDVLDQQRPRSREVHGGSDGSDVRIDGLSTAVKQLRRDVERAAGPTFNVLIHGETGSGKELVAREIHRLSGRAGELISVNIAAIPANLLESELFGVVKGAFTGAERSRRGLVAAAEGGTLFLDEVGDLDVVLQVKLLRFLEAGEVRAVGSDRTRKVDVRVVCATHRNLERRVRAGLFREDLYYRIAVALVKVPPLRQRVEDIPVLRAIFEREAARRYGLSRPVWTSAAEERLLGHSWPGNVRELRHVVETAMARAVGRRIVADDLSLPERATPVRGTWDAALTDFKRRFLTEVLARHDGNRSAAARELNISRQGLLYQIRKLGLNDI